MFGAMHMGLGASWTTMLDKSWGLTVGVIYDYYRVSGARATTNLSGDYYMNWLEKIFAGEYGPDGTDDDWNDMLVNNPTAAAIEELYRECGGWTCAFENEVQSFYKSIGIRVGVAGKF
jgi:hypothetical protein